jgi:hypothetical protein
VVEEMLNKLWSPQQISARLVVEFPGDLEMRVSHETIYQSLFVQSRGALRKELAGCLRTGRARRRPHGRKDPGGYIKDMVVISDRPAEIEDRAVPGHWEGDLIVGALGKSAIVTLVEPQTRYVMLAQIGRDKTSIHVCEAITQQIQRLPEHLVRSLTWDRGKELAAHVKFSVDTGVQVYFCDPEGCTRRIQHLSSGYAGLPRSSPWAARSPSCSSAGSLTSSARRVARPDGRRDRHAPPPAGSATPSGGAAPVLPDRSRRAGHSRPSCQP